MLSAIWKLVEYPDGVLTGFLAGYELTNETLFARAYAYLKELSEKGNDTKYPVSKPIGDKLYELRPHTDEIQLRLLYYFSPTEQKVIVFVHSFVKKTERVPNADRELAKKRRQEREDLLKKKRKGKSNGHRIYN